MAEILSCNRAFGFNESLAAALQAGATRAQRAYGIRRPGVSAKVSAEVSRSGFWSPISEESLRFAGRRRVSHRLSAAESPRKAWRAAMASGGRAASRAARASVAADGWGDGAS